MRAHFVNSIYLLLIIGGLLGCGAREERTFELSACDALDARGSLALRQIPSEEAMLVLRGTGEALSQVVVDQADALMVDTSGALDLEGELRCRCPSSVQLLGAVSFSAEACDLSHLGVYGASQARIAKVQGEHLDLRAAGAAQVELTAVDLEFVSVLASGASATRLAGNADDGVMDLNGSARVGAKDLSVQNLSVHVRGTTHAVVNATAHLLLDRQAEGRVEQTGGGEITSLKRMPPEE